MKYIIFALLLCLPSLIKSQAQVDSTNVRFVPNKNPVLNVIRIPNGKIIIDGVLNESEWKSAAVAGNFTEISPGDNVKPEVETIGYVMYDDDYIYLGFDCYDDTHDNEMGVFNKTGLYITTPEILRVMQIIEEMHSVPLTVEKNGEFFTQAVQPVLSQRPTGDNWTLGWKFSKTHDWIDARKEEKALWIRDTQEYYWAMYIPEHKVMYFAFQGNANKENEPLSDFIKKVFNIIDSVKADKFVLDLRWNYGGNNQLNRSVVVNMIKSSLDEKGKSFTLINRHTFSAAQSLVNALEKYTNTIFIGEPTSSNVNFYADPSRITLPNSGINIAASSLWWQDMDPRDKRKWKAPQIAINYTWQDYLLNRDPALEEVFKYKPQESLYDQVIEKINNQDIAGAIKVYHNYKQDPRNIYLETENEINNLGYYLLEQKKFKEAIEVFKLNTSSYPSSANAFDSLAEAYTLGGMTDLAIDNYEQSLKLDPSNYNGVEQLKN